VNTRKRRTIRRLRADLICAVITALATLMLFGCRGGYGCCDEAYVLGVRSSVTCDPGAEVRREGDVIICDCRDSADEEDASTGSHDVEVELDVQR
jgi:hypothetical protein